MLRPSLHVHLAPLVVTALVAALLVPAESDHPGRLDHGTGAVKIAIADQLGLAPDVAVVTIVATQSDAILVDNDAGTDADPGDTLQFTVVVSNSGDMNAENVSFDETLDLNLTLVAGTIDATPLARPDTFAAIGNIGIDVPAVSGILANDSDPDGSGLAATPITAFDNPSANGGAVSVNTADGSFTYTPPSGFFGNDSFTYDIDDDQGNSDTGVVVIQVSSEIWFIDNTGGGSGGSGTLADPFRTIADFNASVGPAPGDNIYIAETGSAYTTGINLQNNQTLIGEGAAGADLATLLGITAPMHSVTLPPVGGSNPIITNAAGNGVNLASGNTVRGLTIGNTSGIGITGAATGTFTGSELAVNGIGEAIDIDGGNLAVTFDSVSTSNSGAQGIDLNNVTGSMSVTNATSLVGVAGNGIDLTGGTPTITFGGGLKVETTGAGVTGIFATAGTVNVGGTSSTVASPSGTAVNLNGISLGAGWTFSSVSSSGGAGVNLDNIAGSFTASGGTITSGAGTAFRVNTGSSNVTYGGTIINTSGNSVIVSNRGGGTVTFSGPITDSASGINLTSNGSGTVTFSGMLDLDTGTSTAFLATGGGTVNATGAGSTINNTTGVGVNITNTTIGASGVTFQSISVNGAVSGIILNNTGSTGGLTVTGSGTDNSLGGNDSGGVLQSTTGTSIDLDVTRGFNIRSMRIQTPGGDGINALNIAGTNSIKNVTITDIDAANTSAVRIQNSNVSLGDFHANKSEFTNATTGQAMFLVEGTGAVGLTMQVRVDSSLFSDLDPAAYQHTAGLAVGDNPTVSTFFTNNSVIDGKTTSGPIGTSEVNLLKGHSANSRFRVEKNIFRNIGLIGVNNGILNVGGNSNMNGGTITGLIKQNDFSNIPGKTRAINALVEPVAPDQPGVVDITIDGNRFDDLGQTVPVPNGQTAIYVDMRNNVPTSHIRIVNNSIGTGAIAGTTAGDVGISRDGIFVIEDDDNFANTMNLLVQNNTVNVSNNGTGTSGDQIMQIESDNNTTRINATILGNVFNNSATDNGSGIGDVAVRADASGSALCLNLNATGAGDNLGNQDFVVVRDLGATFETQGTSGTDAAVEAFLNAQNSINVDAQGDAGGGFTNAVCPQPQAAPTITPVLAELDSPPVDREATGDDLRFESTDVATRDDNLQGDALGEEVRMAPHTDYQTVSIPVVAKTMAVADVIVPIGTLPPGKSVTIKFNAGVNLDANAVEACNQGTVSGSNFSSVLTDDPDAGGAADPTCTSLDVVLPVELVSFNVFVDGAAVALSWATASETNNAGFDVEHARAPSRAGADDHELQWAVLGFVEGYGSTTERQTYQYTTSELDPGRHYFRLKQIDFDGGFEYSAVVEAVVELPGQFVLEQAYPNPFNPQATVRFGLAVEQPATVRLYDMHGRLVRTLFEGTPASGTMESVQIAGEGLASGTYVVRLETEGFVASRTVVLLK